MENVTDEVTESKLISIIGPLVNFNTYLTVESGTYLENAKKIHITLNRPFYLIPVPSITFFLIKYPNSPT
jgi:hypothetical protein